MKAVAIIQARMGSTRLPGKVLRMLGNHTVLKHVLLRTQASGRFDEIVVATTTAVADDAIVEEAKHFGVSTYRGSEEDALSRYYLAARQARADCIVRITSDCPLLDPYVVRDMIDDYFRQPVDYLSNTIERSFPRGHDCEIFSFTNLEIAYRKAQLAYEREHVTPISISTRSASV